MRVTVCPARRQCPVGAAHLLYVTPVQIQILHEMAISGLQVVAHHGALLQPGLYRRVEIRGRKQAEPVLERVRRRRSRRIISLRRHGHARHECAELFRFGHRTRRNPRQRIDVPVVAFSLSAHLVHRATNRQRAIRRPDRTTWRRTAQVVGERHERRRGYTPLSQMMDESVIRQNRSSVAYREGVPFDKHVPFVRTNHHAGCGRPAAAGQ